MRWEDAGNKNFFATGAKRRWAVKGSESCWEVWSIDKNNLIARWVQLPGTFPTPRDALKRAEELESVS